VVRFDIPRKFWSSGIFFTLKCKNHGIKQQTKQIKLDFAVPIFLPILKDEIVLVEQVKHQARI
jgi:hypothetical protein